MALLIDVGARRRPIFNAANDRLMRCSAMAPLPIVRFSAPPPWLRVLARGAGNSTALEDVVLASKDLDAPSFAEMAVGAMLWEARSAEMIVMRRLDSAVP